MKGVNVASRFNIYMYKSSVQMVAGGGGMRCMYMIQWLYGVVVDTCGGGGNGGGCIYMV